MKSALYILLLLGSLLLNDKVYAQSITLDSVQVDRIAKTCQLWGHLKYFHPYLSDETIDWESAFTNHIEDVIQANDSKEYGDAIQNMLAHLNDSTTALVVEENTLENEDTLKHPVSEFIHDSVLWVSITDYVDLEDVNYARQQFSGIKEKMQLAKGVVFDLRSSGPIGPMTGYLSWYFGNIEDGFSDTNINLPGFTARFHDGFVPETGTSSGGYASGTFTKGERIISPDSKTASNQFVFIVNENSEIPIIALGLQMAGKATIISSTPLTDASLVPPTYFQLDDSMSVSIRQNTLPEDASLNADYIIPANTDHTALVEMATGILKGQKVIDLSQPQEKALSQDLALTKSESDTDLYFPDTSHRILAAAKIWTVIHYFFAYQDLMTEDWDEVLKKSIPKFINASDSLEYHLAVAEMYKNVEDGHGFIRSRILSQYFGQAPPPVKIRYIENQPVVVGLLPDSVAVVKDLDIGDVVLEVDGEKVSDRFDRYAKYIAASNPNWLKHGVGRQLLNGPDSTDIILKVKKPNGTIKTITTNRSRSFWRHWRSYGNGRNDQDMTRLINEDIGYADLDRLTTDRVQQMFEDFKNTKAIIFDMRGYPNGTAWAIAPYLTSKNNVGAANFRRYSPMGINMGQSKNLSIFDQQIPPRREPTYTGKTVMLIDERSMSQSEHTGLFFEAANETVFIGSQTAGANGDVTDFKIPGKIVLSFSGHDVRHIDGRQLQKIGLVPDVPVKPTIEGIVTGKDEVMQRAMEYVQTIIAKE